MAGWLSLNHDLSLNLFGLLVRLAVGFVLLLSLRLAVRFCATNKLLENRRGLLGILKDSGSDATSVTESTRIVVRQFCRPCRAMMKYVPEDIH